jgi:hypothetical protein
VRVRFFTCLVLLFLLPSHARSQESAVFSQEQLETDRTESPLPTEAAPNAMSGYQEEHRRLFWMVPTYSVSNSKFQSALSPREKFRLFAKNASDPFNLGYTAMEAGIAHANNDLAGYGQGLGGYGKRLAAGLADDTSGGFFRTYVFSSLFHQDPRYFRRGSGPLKIRLVNAIIRPVVTRKDSGGHAFNWSGLLGTMAASGLSNAYYPAGDRGIGLTFQRVAFAIPSSVIDHLIDEFAPDLESHFLHRK